MPPKVAPTNGRTTCRWPLFLPATSFQTITNPKKLSHRVARGLRVQLISPYDAHGSYSCSCLRVVSSTGAYLHFMLDFVLESSLAWLASLRVVVRCDACPAVVVCVCVCVVVVPNECQTAAQPTNQQAGQLTLTHTFLPVSEVFFTGG